MEELTQTTNLLVNINQITNIILKNSVKLLKQIKTNDMNDLACELMDLYVNMDTPTANKKLEKTIQNLIEMPQSIRKHIDTFASCIRRSEEPVDCGILSEAWYGDLCDKKENDGLSSLLDDLEILKYRLTDVGILQTLNNE